VPVNMTPSKFAAATATFNRNEHDEIQKIYGKGTLSLHAPEGYEFTGEFRVPKWGDFMLTDTHNPWKPSGLSLDVLERHAMKRLILRPVEKKVEVKVTAPDLLDYLIYDAASVKYRYGTPALSHFYGLSLLSVLHDYPGFTYTGRLEHVEPRTWYLSTTGPRMTQGYGLTGLYLTLEKTGPARIITYTLTDRNDLAGDEAAYTPADDGSMMTDTSDGPTTYTREEVA
jgi:hypothetical protein